MKKMAGDFVRDAKELAKSVRRVFVDDPKPATAEQKKRASGMAGAGGLSGRRRDAARDDIIRNATGEDRRPKARR
jgi:hypothetical protein